MITTGGRSVIWGIESKPVGIRRINTTYNDLSLNLKKVENETKIRGRVWVSGAGEVFLNSNW